MVDFETLLTGKIMNYSYDIHIQICHVILLHFGYFHVKFGPNRWRKVQHINVDENCSQPQSTGLSFHAWHHPHHALSGSSFK